MRKFMRLDYFKEDVPDAATLPRFRHLPGEQDPRKELLLTLNGILEAKGKIMQWGSIADAAIIEVPSSTKNSAKSRDLEMKPTKKGNQWHFGIKARIGVEVTVANVHDLEAAPKLIRADDNFVNGAA
jgi:IS5 family transposase